MKNPLRSLRAVVCALALCALFPASVFAQKVLLIAADEVALIEDVRAKLAGSGLLTQVDVVDVGAPGSTPTLTTLLTYDAVLTWSDLGYAEGSALGDVLADYVDQGRGVVKAVFALDETAPFALSGRWRAGRYDPLSLGQQAVGASLVLKPLRLQHPILEGVLQFNSGGLGFHYAGLTVNPCAEVVASWSNDEPLVAVCSGPQGGNVVALNMFPPSSDAGMDGWPVATDGARLMANALRFAAAAPRPNTAPTADAGTDQTIEATGPAGAAFSLTGAGTDADNDALTFSWAGGAFGNGAFLNGTLLAPAAPSKAQPYTLTLTVDDGHGVASDEAVVTVTDTTGPVLSNLPAAIVTSPSGDALYGPVTAADAVDGARPVSCSPSAPYPVGDTSVTCSSWDTRGNPAGATFIVRVPKVSTPGAMAGAGVVRVDGLRYRFSFAVSEGPAGEGAQLELQLLGHRRHGRDGRFDSVATDSVAFSDDPSLSAGRSSLPRVDTVLFTGFGQWNGGAGYRYEVFAVDSGDSGRQRDALRLIITAPDGTVVAHVDGALKGGAIKSERLRK